MGAPREGHRESGAAAWLLCALAAALAVAAYHALQGDVDFEVIDEGFLWYGVQRTAAGELPLRDFRSYDPGRYFWSAAWSHALGPGVVALRLSLVIFAGVGLALGLRAVGRAAPRAWLLAPLALALALWFFPRWKLFEPAIALAAVYFASRMIESPRSGAHVAAGAFTGLAAFFGRNHGLYVSVAFLATIAFAVLRGPEPGRRAVELTRRVGAWAGGVLLGYSPMLALVAFVPGYASSLWESILYFLEQPSANLAVGAPWPWAVEYDGPFLARVNLFCTGIAFLLVPAFYALALVAVLRTKPADLARRAPFVAAVFVGAVYVHHAATRSDLPHLAQSIPPLWLGLFAWPAAAGARRATALAGGAVLACFALALFVVVPFNNMQVKLFASAREQYVQRELGGDVLWLPRGTARFYRGLERELARHVGESESLFIAPSAPGLYPVLGRVSPTWQTYMAWPASRAEQERTIAELAPVGWALILDFPLAGDPPLWFRDSNPLVWEHLQREFEPAPDVSLPPKHSLLRRRPR